MKQFTNIEALPRFRRPVVTVGSFDGVHRGHLFLLDILRRRAARADGESVVVTFGDHPRRVLGTGDGLRMLTTPDEKARLIAAAGVDNLVVMPFTEQVARMSAEEFVRDFLVSRVGVHELVVGYNHRLGRGREGDIEVLRGLGEKYGFSVFEAPQFSGSLPEKHAFSPIGPLENGGCVEKNEKTPRSGDAIGQSTDEICRSTEKISSTAIRNAIANGDTATAERLLGRKI